MASCYTSDSMSGATTQSSNPSRTAYSVIGEFQNDLRRLNIELKYKTLFSDHLVFSEELRNRCIQIRTSEFVDRNKPLDKQIKDTYAMTLSMQKELKKALIKNTLFALSFETRGFGYDSLEYRYMAAVSFNKRLRGLLLNLDSMLTETLYIESFVSTYFSAYWKDFRFAINDLFKTQETTKIYERLHEISERMLEQEHPDSSNIFYSKNFKEHWLSVNILANEPYYLKKREAVKNKLTEYVSKIEVYLILNSRELEYS